VKLLLCFLFSFSTHALDLSEETLEFRKGALLLLNGAIKTGLYEHQGLNLQAIASSVNQMPMREAITDAAGRRAAFWECNRVTINPRITKNMLPFVRDVLAVHEFASAQTCSALDDGYAFALYVWLKAYNDQLILSHFTWPASTGETVLSYHLKQQGTELGGSSVVGGGGDDRDIHLKILALLCLRGTLSGKECVPRELLPSDSQLKKEVLKKMIRGIMFMHWYTSNDVAEGEYSLRKLKPKVGKIQPVYVFNPKTFDRMVRNDDINTLLQLAVAYADVL